MKEGRIDEKSYKRSPYKSNKAAYTARVYRAAYKKTDTEHLRKGAVRNAGINRGTFYAHYSDIYELLESIEEDMFADFREVVSPLLKEKPDGPDLEEITAGIFRCLRENSDLCAVTLGEYGDKKFASRLLDYGLDICLKSYGKQFPNASMRKIEYFYSFASGGCISILQKWLSDGMKESAEQAAAMAVSMITRGIGFLAGEGS